ncbi:hypothetical protein BDV98DRAFT_575006 [Pterulicium gracile]|uniref:Uncharacterized protein n=1 Tax=Pterulicium gracile TaxID=1884261 RepID=A0A5C3QFQ2_9AGAR|nr:hypothetical protein BDV98DRAFT_575006 [Pterula gracilis]
MFTRVVALALLAMTASAASVGSIAAEANCDNPRVVGTQIVQAGANEIVITDTSCNGAASPFRAAAVAATVDVCGIACAAPTCNLDSGNLPPITEDCQVIKNSITIFNGISTTFSVAPKSLKSLTHGTCTFFLSNLSDNTLTACWADLSVQGSRSGSACFPPVMPLRSQGVCTAVNGVFKIGAGHSGK